jgi:hypothetical protein
MHNTEALKSQAIYETGKSHWHIQPHLRLISTDAIFLFRIPVFGIPHLENPTPRLPGERG